jgi:hypothetical protein
MSELVFQVNDDIKIITNEKSSIAVCNFITLGGLINETSKVETLP